MKKRISWAMTVFMVLGMLGLSVACMDDSNIEKPGPPSVIGTLVSVEERELYYEDSQGFGSGKMITIPITFLELKTEIGEQTKIFILVGPHILKENISVQLTYTPDTDVTGKEIYQRYYTASLMLITCPRVSFKVDGYITAWEVVKK